MNYWRHCVVVLTPMHDGKWVIVSDVESPRCNWLVSRQFFCCIVLASASRFLPRRAGLWLVGELANDIPWYSRRTDVVVGLVFYYETQLKQLYTTHIVHIAFLLHDKKTIRKHSKSLYSRVNGHITLAYTMKCWHYTNWPPIVLMTHRLHVASFTDS